MKCIYENDKAKFIKEVEEVIYPFEEKVTVRYYKCEKSGKIFAKVFDRKYRLYKFPLIIKIDDKKYMVPFNVWNTYASKFVSGYFKWLKILEVFWTEKFLFTTHPLTVDVYLDNVSVYFGKLKFAVIPIKELTLLPD